MDKINVENKSPKTADNKHSVLWPILGILFVLLSILNFFASSSDNRKIARIVLTCIFLLFIIIVLDYLYSVYA